MEKVWNDDLLKLYGIIAMFFVHLGAVYSIPWLEGYGEITTGIYPFLIAKGLLRTHDKNKYLTRLAVFAVISQYPYILCFPDHSLINAIAALLLGALFLEAVKMYGWWVLVFLPLLPIAGIDPYLPLMVLVYGLTKDVWQLSGFIVVIEIIRAFLFSPWALLGIFGIYIKYGRFPVIHVEMNKWTFYVFYPLHLLFLGVIR